MKVYNSVTKLFILSLFIFSLSTNTFAQTKKFRGKVIDEKTDKAIAWARIIRLDSLVETSSDDKGMFVVLLPRKGTQELLITHPDYKPINIKVTPQLKARPQNVIKLENSNQQVINERKAQDTAWHNWKNNIAIAPFDLLNLTATASYERFIKEEHSIGLFASIYIKSKLWIGGSYDQYNDPRMKGFQVAPFYRYYINKGSRSGVFAQGKVIAGYYSLIEWHYSNNSWSEIADFFTAGAGVAIGFKNFLPNSNHGTIEFLIGFKYLPVTSNTAEHEFWDEVAPNASNTPWGGWYGFLGPGSVFEFKILFGGLF